MHILAVFQSSILTALFKQKCCCCCLLVKKPKSKFYAESFPILLNSKRILHFLLIEPGFGNIPHDEWWCFVPNRSSPGEGNCDFETEKLVKWQHVKIKTRFWRICNMKWYASDMYWFLLFLSIWMKWIYVL